MRCEHTRSYLGSPQVTSNVAGDAVSDHPRHHRPKPFRGAEETTFARVTCRLRVRPGKHVHTFSATGRYLLQKPWTGCPNKTPGYTLAPHALKKELLTAHVHRKYNVLVVVLAALIATCKSTASFEVNW